MRAVFLYWSLIEREPERVLDDLAEFTGIDTLLIYVWINTPQGDRLLLPSAPDFGDSDLTAPVVSRAEFDSFSATLEMARAKGFQVGVPGHTIMIPQFMLYHKLNWLNTLVPLFVPAFAGWGVRGGILLIVFRQFLRGLPHELEDAACVDGAGPFRTFWQIMLPLAKPALMVVLVFSLTWTWNDSFIPWLVIQNQELMTLPQRLEIFTWLIRSGLGTVGLPTHFEPNVFMAATVLAIMPVLVLYVFAQRHFTQSIDRTGLVE